MLKTNAVMQQALIDAGLVTQDRAERFNTIIKEQKRQAKQRRRAAQARQAALAQERWNQRAS